MNVQQEVQEALILAEPGEIIELGEGQFDFTGTLSLDRIENVTIRGQGMDKTILSFSRQRAGTGGEGLKFRPFSVIRYVKTVRPVSIGVPSLGTGPPDAQLDRRTAHVARRRSGRTGRTDGT